MSDQQIQNQPSANPESLAQKPKSFDLMSYMKASEDVEKDKQAQNAENILKLKGNVDRMQQLNEISSYTGALISIIGKLKNKGVDLELVKANPNLIFTASTSISSEFNIAEKTALDETRRIFNEKGDTSKYLKEAWPDIVEQGDYAGSPFYEKAYEKTKKSFEEHPVGTTALLVAGAAGVYLGYSLIKSLWDKDDEVVTETDPKTGETKEVKKGEKSWLKAKVLIPIGLMIAGAFLGKEAVAKLIKGMGVEQLQEILDKGEVIPEEARKQIEEAKKTKEEQAKKIEELEGKLRDEVGSTSGITSTAITESKESNLDNQDTVDQIRTEAIETAKDPDTAINLFVHSYFYERTFNDSNIKNKTTDTIKNLKEIPIKDLISIYKKSKYSGKYEVDKNLINISGDKIKVDNKQLYLILEKLTELNGLFDGEKDVKTVNDLFVNLLEKPKFNSIKDFFSGFKEKGIDGVFNSFGDNIQNKILESQDGIINSLNKNFETSLKGKDKNVFREIQLKLLVGTNLTDDPNEAVNEIAKKINPKPNEEVIKESIRFFNHVKEKMPNTLELLKKRYGIKDPETGINRLEESLKVENLTFGSSALILSTIDNANLNGKLSSTKELSILMATVGVLPQNERNFYVGQLTEAIISENTNLNLPALDNLKPYLSKFKDIWAEKFMEKGIAVMQYADSVKYLDGFRDISADTIALIIGMAGITKEELNKTGSGAEFLELLSGKGGIIAMDTNNKALLALSFGGKVFFLKPMEILGDTIANLADGDLGGAVSTWVIGSSPFIVIGGVKGFLKTTSEGGVMGLAKRIPNTAIGMVKGLKYPIFAPIWALKGIKGGITLGASGVALCNELAKKPGRAYKAKLNTIDDMIKYRSAFVGQNVKNMLSTGQIFDNYFEISNLEKTNIADTLSDLKNNPKKVLGRLSSKFNTNMAEKYGETFIKQYDDFFRLSREKRPDLSDVKEIYKKIKNYSENINSHKSLFDEIATILKTQGSNKTTMEEITKKLLTTGLNNQEAEGLAKQMTDEKMVYRIFSKLSNSSIVPPIPKFKPSDDLLKGTKEELIKKLKDSRESLKGLVGAEKALKLQEIYTLSSFLSPNSAIKPLNLDKITDEAIKAKKIGEFASEIEARSIGVEQYVQNEIKKIQEIASKEGKSLADPSIQKQFTKIEKFIEKLTADKVKNLNLLSKEYKNLPSKFRSPELKAKLKFAFENPKGSFATRLKISGKKALIGRLKLGAAIGAGIFALDYFTSDEEQDVFDTLAAFGPTASQLLVDILPFIGTGSMIYGAAAGEESVTGRELDVAERVANGGFGVASLAADVLTVMSAGGGAAPAVAGRLAAVVSKGGKAGKLASILLSKWDKVSRVITKLGPVKFYEKAKIYIEGGKLAKGLKTTQTVGTIGGMGIIGASTLYSFVNGYEVDIPDDIGFENPDITLNEEETSEQKTEAIKEKELAMAG